MEDAGGVRVAWPSIRRRMGNEDGTDLDVFLVFKDDTVKGSPDDLVADVEAAVTAANAALVRGNEELVYAQATLPSVKGPMIQVRYTGTTEQNREWVDLLADSLRAAGRSGTLALAPQASYALFNKIFMVPKVTGFTAYTLNQPPTLSQPPGAGGWNVDPEVTAGICAHAVDWGGFPGADVYLTQSVAMVMVQSLDVSAELANGIRQSLSAAVSYGVNRPPGFNRIALSMDGQVCYQAHLPHLSWQNRVAQVRAALLRDPAALDLGFIRWRIGSVHSWSDLNGVRPRLPYVDEGEVRNNRHLWNRYVPDAHAIQVLTRAHLDKATDLSDWQVSDLPGNRYLVQARDLDPWFTQDVPDEKVLAQARQDFGAMILTHETIQSHPDGWVRGRPMHRPTDWATTM